ncbi:hypothetical protein [Propionivibrio sp.]|uniref:hypothetical protein n=1 Tax=Propionivibrio sp. TaxID=2212460 RepID=UPI003BEFED29
MTFQPDNDYITKNTVRNENPGFESIESAESAMRSGIRVRASELAKLVGVSKQAVSQWCKDGRITLGADGRVDPREAISRLLEVRPERLRAVFLKPLVTDIAANRVRISQLETALRLAAENGDFHESSSRELLALFYALPDRVGSDWPAICASGEDGLTALLAWLDAAFQFGVDRAGSVIDHLHVHQVDDDQAHPPTEDETLQADLAVPAFDEVAE